MSDVGKMMMHQRKTTSTSHLLILAIVVIICLNTSSICTAFIVNVRNCNHHHCHHDVVGSCCCSTTTTTRVSASDNNVEEVDILIVGGGISGLTAAITAATEITTSLSSSTSTQTPPPPPKILVLESTPNLGGRVQSKRHPSGYLLDRGFAVFLTAYPQSKNLLDYDALRLRPFVAGALLQIRNSTKSSSSSSSSSSSRMARVVNPIRHPLGLWETLTTPVGTFRDKLRLLPLVLYVLLTPIPQLFSNNNNEMSTYTCLTTGRYNFSEKMINEFFRPFLEGIYLCPLEYQSSDMFHFVLRMFVLGVAALPEGGMQSVSDQLVEKVGACSEVRVGRKVEGFRVMDRKEEGEGGIRVIVGGGEGEGEREEICARSVVLATEGVVAQRLVSTLGDQYDSLAKEEGQVQRSVGCLYYGFDGPAPIKDGILVLNGKPCGDGPINNLCFPSNVHKSYAPRGYGLCSVTVLEEQLKHYDDTVSGGADNKLDDDAREQLTRWFPEHAEAIRDRDRWVLLDRQVVMNAQPSQLGGPSPANRNGGRDCEKFWGRDLPEGFYVCGDHMATASLNGAIESGVNAGKAASAFVG